MNTIDVGTPTFESMDEAMATMGFVKTSASTATTHIYRWGNDSEGKCLIGLEDTMYLHYDFGSTSQGIVDLRAYLKICYEPLARGGIALGFVMNSSDTLIQIAFVAPKSSTDDWVFIPYNVDYNYVCDYSTDRTLSYSANSFYSSVGVYSNDVQIHKTYNGTRFMDNLYRTTLQPQLVWGGNVRATIGTTEYLLFRPVNGTFNLWAVELPS
jgi:hypothetical protein